MKNRLNHHLVKRLLKQVADTKDSNLGDLLQQRFATEELEKLAKVHSNIELLDSGGEFLGVVRSWIKAKAVNGESVTWASSEPLLMRGRITVLELELLAASIAAAAINEYKGMKY
jgi:hypothetical protein